MSRIGPYLLNVAYLGLLAITAPWIVWAMVRQGKYRQGYAEKLLGQVPKRAGKRPCLWMHAVSVGEVQVLRTLVAEFAARRPDVELVISTTTKTGYDLARRRFGEQIVFYCPLDFSWAVQRAMRRIRPNMLLLAELELWPNLIWAAKKFGATVAIVNGRLSDNSFRGYQRIRPFVARVLKMVDLIAAQDETTANRFHALGANPDQIHVTGSIKYDGAETNRANQRTRSLRTLAALEDSDTVFVAGSTQDPEEKIVLATFDTLLRNHPNLKLLLIPRHPERFDEVARWIEETGLVWQRRSTLDKDPAHARPCDSAATMGPWQVLLVDTVGELGAWWGTADIGFVGGSLGSRGGQNMIEPAAYGVATSFGPNTRNFRDIVANLLNAKAAVVVRDGSELTAFVRHCLDNPDWAESLGQRARQWVQTQLGATQRTIDRLDPILRSGHWAEKKPRSAA
ncbi:MAG: 3-deoxy-D-manno-octulosonic acid transferase [Pirellulales bacterium]|nr:3-deoxy-D-manno-octulosonic acid transferase [Pirellulales bacterium]